MYREHTHDPSTGAVRVAGSTHESALPKILAVIAIIGFIKAVASHKRGHGNASSWRDRRKSMIADLHRELHRQDAQAGDAPTEGTAKA
jgi:hypothetical protein